MSSFSRRNKNRQGSGDLRIIPGIGPSLASDLRRLGIRTVSDLDGKDPEKLYRALEGLEGAHIDRCVLYAFRCAVYFAEHTRPDPEKLKWWNWKDAALSTRRKKKARTRRQGMVL